MLLAQVLRKHKVTSIISARNSYLDNWINQHLELKRPALNI